MLLEKGDRLLMIGDSITEAPKGGGYVDSVTALLQCTYPELGIGVINKGIGGNTSRDLKRRWQEDVLDHRPEWLSIMIGINDVWGQFSIPNREAHAVDLDEYEATLRELIGSVQLGLKGLILMTPYYMESNRNDAMRIRMDEYSSMVKKLAAENNAILVDTQSAMDELMQVYYPGAIATDRVHPKRVGHMAIARAFLKAVGFVW